MTEEFDFEAFKSQAIEELKSGKGISGSDNVLLPMIKHLLEEGLKAELDLHVKSEKALENDLPTNNRKNGSSSKTMTSSLGTFTLDTPRDRNGNFDPKLVEKQQVYLDETFAESILSLYSKGLSHEEIRKHLINLYGVKISSGKISEITDRILPEIEKWKNRQLESIYSVIWMDALHFSVRDDSTKRFVKKVDKTVRFMPVISELLRQ